MDARLGPEPSPALFADNVETLSKIVSDLKWVTLPETASVVTRAAALYGEVHAVWKQRVRLRAAGKPHWESSGAKSEAWLTDTPLAAVVSKPAPKRRRSGISGFSGAFGTDDDSDGGEDDALDGAAPMAPAVPPLPTSDAELSQDGVYCSSFETAMLRRWQSLRSIADTDNLAVTGRQATMFAIQNTARQMEMATSAATASKDPAAILPGWRGFKFEKDMATPEQLRIIEAAEKVLPTIDASDADTLRYSLAKHEEAKNRFMANAMHMALSDKESARVASQVENEAEAEPTAMHTAQMMFVTFATAAVAIHGTRVPWMHATLSVCGMENIVPDLASKRFTDYTLHDVWRSVEAVRGVWKKLALFTTAGAGGSGPRLTTWIRGMVHVLGVLFSMKLPAELVDGGSGAMLKACHVSAIKEADTVLFVPSLWCVANLGAALTSMLRDVRGVAAVVSRIRPQSRFDEWTHKLSVNAHAVWGIKPGDAVSRTSSARRTLSQSTAAVNLMCYLSGKMDGMVSRQLRHWTADCFESVVRPGSEEAYVHSHPTSLKQPSRVEAAVLFDKWPPPEDVLQEFINELPGGPDAIAAASDVATSEYRALADVVADAYVAGGTAGGDAGDDSSRLLGDDEYVSRTRRWLAQRPRVGSLLLLRAFWNAVSSQTGEDIYNGDNSLLFPCNLLAASVEDSGPFETHAVDDEDDRFDRDGELPMWVVDVHAGWYIVVVQQHGTPRRTRPLLANEVVTLLSCLIATFEDANPDLLRVVRDAVRYVTSTVHPSRLVQVALSMGRRTSKAIADSVDAAKRKVAPKAPAETAVPFRDKDVVLPRLKSLFGGSLKGADALVVREWTGITANIPPGDMRLALENRSLVPSAALLSTSATGSGVPHAVDMSGSASEALKSIETKRRQEKMDLLRRRGERLAHTAVEDSEDADVGGGTMAARVKAVMTGKARTAVTTADLEAARGIEEYIVASAAKAQLDPFEALLAECGNEPPPATVFQTAMH